jgi:heat shock protein HslJ
MLARSFALRACMPAFLLSGHVLSRRVPSRLVVLCGALSLAPALWAAPASAPKDWPASNTPLRDTRWTLQTIEGTPAAASGSRGQAQLSLRAASQHLTGFAGCNTLSGRYIQRGTSLVLKPLATTRMACEPQVMQQETRFLQALATVDTYRVEGRQLSLLQGEVVKLTFVASAPR